MDTFDRLFVLCQHLHKDSHREGEAGEGLNKRGEEQAEMEDHYEYESSRTFALHGVHAVVNTLMDTNR